MNLTACAAFYPQLSVATYRSHWREYAHAIYVRDLNQNWGSIPRILAYAIEKLETAERVVHGIVRSYPTCGLDPISDVHWFPDADGLQELWVTPR